MNGITFGDLHSYRDLSLILKSKQIGTPAPKIKMIDIPGGDGAIDATEFFNEVKYQNRSLIFEFSTVVPKAQFMTLFGTVQNLLHGQRMKIALDEDPDWYYIGRISVSEWKADKNIGSLTIECDCEPYRYRLSSQAVYLCGANLLNLDLGTAVATHETAWTKTETGYAFNRGNLSGGSFFYFNVPLKKGQTYIFSADYGLTAQTLYVYKDRLYGTVAKNGNPCVFTADETKRYIFGLYCASGVTNAVFSNVMLREGSAKESFVPYDAAEKTVDAAFGNTRKNVVPKAYVTGSATVESESVFATLTAGAQVLDGFTFYKGENHLLFKGNGVIVVEWLERGL